MDFEAIKLPKGRSGGIATWKIKWSRKTALSIGNSDYNQTNSAIQVFRFDGGHDEQPPLVIDWKE